MKYMIIDFFDSYLKKLGFMKYLLKINKYIYEDIKLDEFLMNI